MFHKVKNVKALPDYRLSVHFENGETRCYDAKPLWDRWEAFRAFQTVRGLFEQVRVDVGGYGVSWNDDLDLSCNELYDEGIESRRSLL